MAGTSSGSGLLRIFGWGRGGGGGIVSLVRRRISHCIVARLPRKGVAALHCDAVAVGAVPDRASVIALQGGARSCTTIYISLHRSVVHFDDDSIKPVIGFCSGSPVLAPCGLGISGSHGQAARYVGAVEWLVDLVRNPAS